MGPLTGLFDPWRLLQVFAIIHFIRRRPDSWWLWVILFLGPTGGAIYLVAEALPDLRMAGASFKVFPRRKRIRELEATVEINPSAGNWEELGDLLMEDGRFHQARAAFDKAIAARAGGLDPFYRRGVCALELGDAAASVPDLEQVVREQFDYDFTRAAGLLAHAYALTGEPAKAETIFRHALEKSTLSETYLNFAALLAAQGRNAEAQQYLQRVLDKNRAATSFIRRRERPWTRRARRMQKQIPA